MSPVAIQVRITRLAGEIGAEVGGVDAAETLPDDVVAQVRQALLDHKVIFLRDQRLDYAAQVAFARRFGELTLGHPTIESPPGQPLIEEIDSAHGVRANQWHTDVTFVDRPPAITMLRAVVIPEVGGDTLWANTVTAYASLPAELRDLADRLRVVHTNAYDYAAGIPVNGDAVVAAHRRQFVSTVFKTERLMQNLAVNPSTGFLARLLQKSRTRLTNTRQRLLRPIERRFLSQTFHDGEAVAVRAYVRTGRRSTRRT
jgi:taurine dioxygenase